MKIAYVVNIIRILIALSLLCLLFSDLYGIVQDPTTYERVYTGEFLGEDRYESLSQLKTTLVVQTIAVLIYLILIILHITILKNKKTISYLIKGLDVTLVIFIFYHIFW